ncbi:Glycosyltransferase involved in cell wall bisynthesis [Flavobacterium succinicans]|uniref:Glycosyltransferase involved in cell wall bisynthesis n=1 Tax=Flavobacterium succinicans TaxID=29536 RepID=A0A1I4ZMD6_9FLAO|nr:glycosyltransferase family 4 protein [Flavobacterium succinicans]SFN51130.1 Glycosyltransferase involved in cell wall bisynthesis [Flavobacterium succinicans]
MSNKTILATCYSINPYKDLEDGMGWNLILQIARYQKVIAITREKNQASIEKYLSENTNPAFNNITFLYFDLPYGMRFWEKGGLEFWIFYYIWQRSIVSFIKKQTLYYDIVHHINFHNDLMPSFLWKLNKPMVLGPVGHQPRIQKQYLKLYSKKQHLSNELNWFVKKIVIKHSPAMKKTIEKTAHTWCTTPSTPVFMGLKENTFSIHPSIVSDDSYIKKPKKTNQFRVLSVGRFVAINGFDLTLHSFIGFVKSLPNTEQKLCKLILVGTGPEKELYLRIIQENQVENLVEIIEKIDRQSLIEQYQEATVFLFPSHEGNGMVVAEALSFGLPIICLNNDEFCHFIDDSLGISVPVQSYTDTVIHLKQALLKLYKIPHLTDIMSSRARKHYENKFSWNSRESYLQNIYNKIA